MKYCKICGTLLEDTHEHCIRCGADVTLEENVSMYPIEVMETMEEENKRKKATGKLVAMIIALVVVLAGLVIFFLYGLDTSGIDLLSRMNPDAGFDGEDLEAEDEEPEEEEAEPEPTPEPTPEPKKVFKDDKGFYYDYVVETDDAGNAVFTAIVPEDLTEREIFRKYDECCDRYPFTINFTASTKDDDVRFSYLSPRKLWYKVSSNGRSLAEGRDITNHMSYLTYDGPRSYLEALLAGSYEGAKFEIRNEYDVSPGAASKLEELAKSKKSELSGSIGDYAHIGKDTSYTSGDFEYSAKVYDYEITLKDKNMLFCRYYIPSMAHTLEYSGTSEKGTITEWYNFAIICFETGNEDEFDDYEEAFNLFIANALPTDLFMFINESYSKEVKKAVSSQQTADPLDDTLLKKYGSEYTPSSRLDDFDTKVMEILRSADPSCFASDNAAVYVPDSIKCAYFDANKKKIFISPDGTEYPGEAYEELKITDAASSAPSAAVEPPPSGSGEDIAPGPDDLPEELPEGLMEEPDIPAGPAGGIM